MGQTINRQQKVAIDSRNVQPGDCFYALAGERTDGHKYLKCARDNGATHAVVNKRYTGPDFGMQLVYVDDVLVALQSRAREFLKVHHPKIIAVTGSVGKTTTKEYIAHLLSKRFRVGKTPMSYNSQRGLPVAILNQEEDREVLVLEMSMTEKGNISNLVSIAPPDIAVITHISLGHSENFSSVEGIAEAKAEIFSPGKTKTAFIAEQASRFESMQKNCPSDMKIVRKIPEGIDAPDVVEHFQRNFALAAALALSLGVSAEEINELSKNLPTMKGRFQKIEKEGVLLVHDSYNSNPASLGAAIHAISNYEGRKIAVLGTMAELGSFSDREHQRLGQKADEIFDEIFCYGNGWKQFLPGKKSYCDLEELAVVLKKEIKQGDVVLVKGSLSTGLWKIIDRI